MADARALWSACAQTLNSYCDAACPLFRTHGALVAAVGGSRLSKTERAWRCYANAALDERGDYHGGAEYCTRHAVLSAMAEECATSSEPRVAAAVSASAAGAAVAVDVSPLTPWPLADVKEVTIPAVDATTWQATRDAELMRVHAWSVPCIDSLAQHTLNNRTRNVSRRKAFLSRAGLACYGTCVRGVVDGFATPTELAPLLAIAPVPMPGVPSNILSWRWEVPSEPPIFRTLVARAHAVLTERFGVSNLRFYRSNMITWLAGRCVGGKAECAEWPATPRPWQPSSLHGDTNTDEMCTTHRSNPRPTAATGRSDRVSARRGGQVHLHDHPVPCAAWCGRGRRRDRPC